MVERSLLSSTRVGPLFLTNAAAQTAARFALVGAVGLALGVLTAYAQGWLPEQVGSLANSAGSWALVAFALALPAANGRLAAAFGSLSLLALLAGYVLGARVRGYPSSASTIAFWGAAAMLAGPLLGLSAHWVRTGRGPVAAAGIGAMSGVLVGEGVHGLVAIADTTYPAYWWGEIVAGVVLLILVARRRLRGVRTVVLSVVVTVSAAAAFVVVYSRDLLALLP